MNHHFKEQLTIRVTAAQIGVSAANWDHAEAAWSEEKAMQFMQEKAYDLLPIRDDQGNFSAYWATEQSGIYDQITQKPLAEAPSIYYLTELKDLLTKLTHTNQASFFLTDHEKIVGLVTNSNLNAKPVYVYFYNLLSALEIELGSWIQTQVPESDILDWLENKVAKSQGHSSAEEVLGRYKGDVEKNEDNSLVQYLYFSQFEDIVKKWELFGSLGYESKGKFEKGFKIIKKYRNWFAHPLNSPNESLKDDLYRLHYALEELQTKLASAGSKQYQ